MQQILIIGAGNMGCAIGRGLLQNTDNQVYFKTLEGIETDTTDFTKAIGENRVFFNDYYDAFFELKNPWVILAVKPHLVAPIIQEAAEFLTKAHPKALISVAAGIDIAHIQTALDHALMENPAAKTPIIRAMPNTPVATGHGLMGFFTHHKALENAFADLCQPLGKVPNLPSEDAFHLFTALAGSGPAYVFHFVEALSEAAIMQGMDQSQAKKIALQTFLGAAELLKHQPEPTQLRKNVTSPNGTTQAGLEQLMNEDLSPQNSQLTSLLEKTLNAAKKRSKNMA